MKTYKDNSEIEQSLQKVEALMQELNLVIDICSNGITIRKVNGENTQEGRIMDIESHEYSTTLPRMFEHELIVLND